MIIGAAAVNAVAVNAGLVDDPVRFAVSEALARSWKYVARLDFSGSPPGLFTTEIPISSLQGRMSANGSVYISVVVPNPLPYQSDLDFFSANAGRLYITREVYDNAGALITSGDILFADIETLRYDAGARSESASIEARGVVSTAGYWTPIALYGASYRNSQNGKRRYRCTPNTVLRPGDTVNINGEQFVVGDIVLTVSPSQEIMEIAEAA